MLDMFRSDTRAIRGLSVRLVIVLVADIASMSVMLDMLSEVRGLTTSELDVKPTPDVVGPGEQALDFAVVDHEGNLAEGTTVVMKSGTAEIDGVTAAKGDDSGLATVNVDAELGVNREDGALVMDVKPPAGESFVSRRKNANVLVVQD